MYTRKLLGFLWFKIPSMYNDYVVSHYREHSENAKRIGQKVECLVRNHVKVVPVTSYGCMSWRVVAYLSLFTTNRGPERRAQNFTIQKRITLPWSLQSHDIAACLDQRSTTFGGVTRPVWNSEEWFSIQFLLGKPSQLLIGWGITSSTVTVVFRVNSYFSESHLPSDTRLILGQRVMMSIKIAKPDILLQVDIMSRNFIGKSVDFIDLRWMCSQITFSNSEPDVISAHQIGSGCTDKFWVRNSGSRSWKFT